MEDTAYWLAFSRVPRVGVARAQKLVAYFSSLSAAWKANAFDLKAAGMEDGIIGAILKQRKTFDPEAELCSLRERGIDVLAMPDDGYPFRLREIQSPPMVLYVRGGITPEDSWAVGMVGTRRATTYGRNVASQLASDLVRNGVTIVSGLAKGIDAVSHKAALDAGGRTVAVLGSGVDQIYPWENRHLAERILESGAIISEYQLGTKPDAYNFPPRNRIITGMSLGVIVVEADMRSGAMISAGFAAEQGREVMAVPANITSPSSKGVHYLIQQGAKLVTCVDDVLEELNLEQVAAKQIARETVPADPTEALLMKHLSTEPVHIDELSRLAAMPVSTVTSALTLMELKGLARSVGAMQYVLS